MQNETVAVKQNLIRTKSLAEILSFLRIEREGTEIKNSLLQPNMQHCVRIADNTYKIEEKKTEIKTEFEIRIKNKEGKKIFSCLLNQIYKIVDKQSHEGKLTFLMEIDRKKYNVMLFKSTKELIEHFLGKIKIIKNNLNKIQGKSESISTAKNTTSSERESKKSSTNLVNAGQKNVYNRRKFNELYKKQKVDINIKRKKDNDINSDILPLNIQNLNLFKDINRINKELSIKKPCPVIYLCEVFPDYLTYQIFHFLDTKSLLWKVCLINRELKKVCDSYIDKIKLEDDTPNEVFHRILSRFSFTKNK